MQTETRLKLSVMMFLEFFIWGVWFVTMGTYLTKTLGFSDSQNGLAYGTQSWGAIIAPFIIGLIADRFFAAQRILGVIHLIGAGLLYYISMQEEFGNFYPLLLGYMILYMPTLALVNSIAFRQIRDQEKEFASIRVLGTIGWIAAGLLIAWMNLEAEGSLRSTFQLAAGASALLGLFSFALPHTPPTASGKSVRLGDMIGLDALKLLKNKNFLVFFIASMLICIPLAFYYQEANKFLNEIGMKDAAGKMVLGQVSEAAFLALMPLFFRRFGIKTMLMIGMFAWILRYVLFAYGDTASLASFLYLGILLHGICYDFFFVTGQIYTDKLAGEKFKSSAQGLITLATYGIGMMAGFWIAGQISQHYKITGVDNHHWQEIWLIPAAFAALVLLLFGVFFKDQRKATEKAEPVKMV